MEIEIWDGGLQEQEIEAIKKIGAAFSDAQPDDKSQARGGSLRDQRQSKLGRNSMFPWMGYIRAIVQISPLYEGLGFFFLPSAAFGNGSIQRPGHC